MCCVCCGSCIELAILRLQTCYKHRHLRSRWEFSFFDSEGVHDTAMLNSRSFENRWDSLNIASANSLREELEFVAKRLANSVTSSPTAAHCTPQEEDEEEMEDCDSVHGKILALHEKSRTVKQIQAHYLLAALQLPEHSIQQV